MPRDASILALNAETQRWTNLLMGHPSSAKYWVGSIVPRSVPFVARLGVHAGSIRASCPGVLREPREGTDDSAAICEPYWPARGMCTLQSIGIGGSWAYEEAIARERDCAVDAFDPTAALRSKHVHQVKNLTTQLSNSGRPLSLRFHFAGLGPATHQFLWKNGPGLQSGQGRNYGSISTDHLMTLSSMAAISRGTSVLKLDCEGCEWVAFEHIATATPDLLRNTSLLHIELHVGRTMISPTSQAQFASIFRYLFEKLRFKIWRIKGNPGYYHDRHAIPWLRSFGLAPKLCCYELALVQAVPL